MRERIPLDNANNSNNYIVATVTKRDNHETENNWKRVVNMLEFSSNDEII